MGNGVHVENSGPAFPFRGGDPRVWQCWGTQRSTQGTDLKDRSPCDGFRAHAAACWLVWEKRK